jgi:hypothetical protein
MGEVFASAGCHHPLVDLLLNEGVVAREAAELPGAEAIDATITHVRHDRLPPTHGQGGDGGGHSPGRGHSLRILENPPMALLDGLPQRPHQLFAAWRDPRSGPARARMTEPLLQAVHRHGRGDVPSAFRPHAVGDGKEPQPRETRHGVVVAVPDKATVRRAGGLDAHGLSRIIMQSAGDGSKKRAWFSE